MNIGLNPGPRARTVKQFKTVYRRVFQNRGLGLGDIYFNIKLAAQY